MRVRRRVVQLDRRAETVRDEDGVRERFGVGPASIPDYLALVGDSADGFPGLPGWGAKSAAAVLARYGHLEEIPDDPADWDVAVRGAARLAAALARGARGGGAVPRPGDAAHATRRACSRTGVGELRWRGPAAGLARPLRRARRARTCSPARTSSPAARG